MRSGADNRWEYVVGALRSLFCSLFSIPGGARCFDSRSALLMRPVFALQRQRENRQLRPAESLQLWMSGRSSAT
jgi:hypothetical protein